MDANIKDSNKLLHCSFCGKNQNEVNKLIAGPSVFICDECVELCNEIIKEELEEKSSESKEGLPKPHVSLTKSPIYRPYISHVSASHEPYISLT